MKVIVIGGGAAGLVAAICASNGKNDITILERNNICGKKILVTGNGKCNYWNADQDLTHYHSSNPEYLKQIITHDIQKKVLYLFASLGIVPKIKDGYYYPYSNQATSIQTSLILQSKLLNIKIETNVYANEVLNDNNKYIIKTNNGEYFADKVVLATGSKASFKNDYVVNSYELVKKMGHSLIKPLPSLVQLKGSGNYFKDWAGVKQDVKVSLLENNTIIKEEFGEIVLTDYGLSGICVMQLSGMVARGLDLGKKEKVIINFIPWLGNTENDFISWMDNRVKIVLKRNITELLDGILNYKLVNLLIKKSKLKPNMEWQNLDYNAKLILARNIMMFEQEIISTNSFDRAQVCSGGVPLSEINPQTMESLKHKGLYLVGELLDVNGDCGGYNLGFAWMSGFLAGQAISKEK